MYNKVSPLTSWLKATECHPVGCWEAPRGDFQPVWLWSSTTCFLSVTHTSLTSFHWRSILEIVSPAGWVDYQMFLRSISPSVGQQVNRKSARGNQLRLISATVYLPVKKKTKFGLSLLIVEDAGQLEQHCLCFFDQCVLSKLYLRNAPPLALPWLDMRSRVNRKERGKSDTEGIKRESRWGKDSEIERKCEAGHFSSDLAGNMASTGSASSSVTHSKLQVLQAAHWIIVHHLERPPPPPFTTGAQAYQICRLGSN